MNTAESTCTLQCVVITATIVELQQMFNDELTSITVKVPRAQNIHAVEDRSFQYSSRSLVPDLKRQYLNLNLRS